MVMLKLLREIAELGGEVRYLFAPRERHQQAVPKLPKFHVHIKNDLYKHQSSKVMEVSRKERNGSTNTSRQKVESRKYA